MGSVVVEKEFFHGVARKAFQGLMLRRMWVIVARLFGTKTKYCPGAQCLIQNQVVQLPLSAEFPLWGPQTLTHTQKAQEGQDSEMQNCCVTHPHLYVCHQGSPAPRRWACTWACSWACTSALCSCCGEKACKWRAPGLWYISLSLGRGKVSFKLTTFFLILFKFALGKLPIQSLSWVFWDAIPLSYLVFLPDFSRLDTSLYGHHFGSYNAAEIPLWFPHYPTPHPSNYQASCSQERLQHPSFLPVWGGCGCPLGACEAAPS